jgi:hypothetical protein
MVLCNLRVKIVKNFRFLLSWLSLYVNKYELCVYNKMESDVISIHFGNTYIQYCWLDDGQEVLTMYSEGIMIHGKHIPIKM